MSRLAQGDICWVEIPDAGRRPALVVTRDAAIPVLNAVLVAPVTRSIRRIPTEIMLGSEDGLSIECAANFDNLRLVPRWTLTDPVGRLAAVKTLRLCRALRAVADC
ncbi:hypothetical protein BH23ACT7_BH23ACT7_10080 [soil metagenome]